MSPLCGIFVLVTSLQFFLIQGDIYRVAYTAAGEAGVNFSVFLGLCFPKIPVKDHCWYVLPSSLAGRWKVPGAGRPSGAAASGHSGQSNMSWWPQGDVSKSMSCGMAGASSSLYPGGLGSPARPGAWQVPGLSSRQCGKWPSAAISASGMPPAGCRRSEGTHLWLQVTGV